MIDNKYEYAARQKKVAKLVEAFASVGIVADKARLMTDAEWDTVCKTLGFRGASTETRQQVIQDLEYRNAPKSMTVREWQKGLSDAVWG